MELNISKLTPSPVRVLCEKMEPDKPKNKKTKSGIILPGDVEGVAKDPKTLARVISFGSEIKTKLKKDDVIYFVPFGGQEFTLDDKTYLFLTEGEILGVFA